jgi:hypothetical protein
MRVLQSWKRPCCILEPWMGCDSPTTIFPGSLEPDAATLSPFSSILNLPNLSRLINDPVHHDMTWPPIPTKIPSDILKFEGKTGEDPGDHITTFHLWFSSNSLKTILFV